MKIKARINKEAYEALSDEMKELFTLVGDEYILNVEGIADHPDAKGLKTALERERKEKKVAEDAHAALADRVAGLPDDFNLAEYNKLKDAKDNGGDVEKRLADQRDRLTTEFSAKEKKLITERDTYKGRSEKFNSDAALNEALADAGIAKPFLPAARAMFKDKIKVSYEGDEAIVTIDNVGVADSIKAWAQSDDGKHFVSADQNQGGGAGGGKPPANEGENPWSKETFNLTKQMEMQKADPAKAERLKASAKK